MEPLWSLAGAISGNRWQMQRPRERLKQAKTVAVGCDRLPFGAHGKEGVDGSSPSEGSAKVQHVAAFAFSPTCRVGSVRWVWSRLWSFALKTARAGACQRTRESHGPDDLFIVSIASELAWTARRILRGSGLPDDVSVSTNWRTNADPPTLSDINLTVTVTRRAEAASGALAAALDNSLAARSFVEPVARISRVNRFVTRG